MSLAHTALIFVHILLMVFWIGADIGVFIVGFFFIHPDLSVVQRTTAIELGLVIDRLPRICFVLILPVGLQLAKIGNHLDLPDDVLGIMDNYFNIVTKIVIDTNVIIIHHHHVLKFMRP